MAFEQLVWMSGGWFSACDLEVICSSTGLFIVKEHYYKWTLWDEFIASIRCPDFHSYFVIEKHSRIQFTYCEIWHTGCRLTALFWLWSYCKLVCGIPYHTHALNHGNTPSDECTNTISDLMWFKGFCESFGKALLPKAEIYSRPIFGLRTNVYQWTASPCVRSFPFNRWRKWVPLNNNWCSPQPCSSATSW